ncbi:hypothetical protein [Hydrogenophaga laconesensis]|uniref:Uncharacterized protein n=1 Tax=Hydrogenophaga laconesensis TaxID=1805971 RepID=A0ABU1V7E5_9BURK|nr:hypothetical protein [Hydrogenophaga laconesensis]MDR7093381.1 hypothetical protein [Hydrogenophaga laconesensis]
MHLSALSVVGYLATLVIAVAAAAVHPWLDVEAHFVRAVSSLSTAVATLTTTLSP